MLQQENLSKVLRKSPKIHLSKMIQRHRRCRRTNSFSYSYLMSTPYLIPNLLSHKIKGLKASKLELDWENFVEIVQKELPDSYKQQFTPCSESQEFGLNPWSGTQILEEAISFLLKGWKEGADTLKKVQESLPKELFEKILPSQSFQKTQHHVVS